MPEFDYSTFTPLAVGDPVYQPYTPAIYGCVLAVEIRKEGRHPLNNNTFYLIRWKDGTERWEWNNSVKSYDELVRDHERKLATAQRKAGEARKLHPDWRDENPWGRL